MRTAAPMVTKVLNRSGPGDDFMTPEFQETLSDNQMTAQSVGIQ
jgi:dolichyl-phosphate-mannose-protein mannosyltransferase